MDESTAHRHHRAEIFNRYQRCQDQLTDRQWEVVALYFQDGKSQETIANELGKSRAAVSGLLRRAKKRKESYEKTLREERFQVGRRSLPQEPD